VDVTSSPEQQLIIHERKQDLPRAKMRTCKYRYGGCRAD
jgi:hypothetical protein